MARRLQQSTPLWALIPCAAVCVGLGYFAASRRRKHRATDVIKTMVPHPDWTPGQKQSPVKGLDVGKCTIPVYLGTWTALHVEILNICG